MLEKQLDNANVATATRNPDEVGILNFFSDDPLAPGSYYFAVVDLPCVGNAIYAPPAYSEQPNPSGSGPDIGVLTYDVIYPTAPPPPLDTLEKTVILPPFEAVSGSLPVELIIVHANGKTKQGTVANLQDSGRLVDHDGKEIPRTATSPPYPMNTPRYLIANSITHPEVYFVMAIMSVQNAEALLNLRPKCDNRKMLICPPASGSLTGSAAGCWKSSFEEFTILSSEVTGSAQIPLDYSNNVLII